MNESVEPLSNHNLFFGPLFNLFFELSNSPVVLFEVMAGLGGLVFCVSLQFLKEFLA